MARAWSNALVSFAQEVYVAYIHGMLRQFHSMPADKIYNMLKVVQCSRFLFRCVIVWCALRFFIAIKTGKSNHRVNPVFSNHTNRQCILASALLWVRQNAQPNDGKESIRTHPNDGKEFIGTRPSTADPRAFHIRFSPKMCLCTTCYVCAGIFEQSRSFQWAGVQRWRIQHGQSPRRRWVIIMYPHVYL